MDVAAARSAGDPFLFLSPHLDDAVLSCGALMRSLSGSCPLTVLTFFTEASPPPHTFAARSFLRQCAFPDAGALFRARRAEDRQVLDALGAEPVHGGHVDALFRRRGAGTPLTRRAGRLLPELAHRYPTYRFDIARGRVARADRGLVDVFAAEVADRVRRTGARWVFCPLGVGRHVDHLLVREVGARVAERVVYYADFPYTRTAVPDPAFLARHRLVPWSFGAEMTVKQELILGYRTQVDGLFPDGRIPAEPETYYATPD